MRQHKKNGGALKRKMFLGMILTLIPVLIVVTILFWQTRSALKEEYIRTSHHDLREISRNVDEKLEEVSSMSDDYAGNEKLNAYAEKDYSRKSQDYKKSDIVRIHQQVIQTIDWLNRREKISAVYTNKGVLLNFQDPNNDTPQVRERLEKMDVNSQQSLMRLIWYPVQENFLTSAVPEDIHKKMAVFCSRRVYSWKHNQYEYAQIFALEESVFYNLYREKADSLHGEIYIVNGSGELISTSDEKSLESCTVPGYLKDILSSRSDETFEIKRDGENKLVSVEQSTVNDWVTVMIVPAGEVMKNMDSLYLKFFIILLVCMGISGLMMLWLYKSFMEPIGKLNNSMREVYGGNLDAYVEVKDYTRRNEINDMMVYYNSMLRRINTHIIEGLKADRKKKELELEVLMSQINPHFLYNTLENIVWKSSEAGRPDIGRMAASLGRMYRLSISGGQVIVPMEHEIEHLMAYVKIQQSRYGDGAEFDLRTDMAQIHELYSLKILLQPIVENSFLYGMDGLDRLMVIRMTIREKGGWVTIKVLDNGKGMDKKRLEEVRTQIHSGRKYEKGGAEKNRRSTGIGLNSVEMRIKLYFGLDHAVSIYSKEGQGTLVVVKIPRITKEDVDEEGNLKGNSKE